MTTGTITVKGIVHGKIIELERDSGIPEGQAVSVVLRPAMPPGEGLRKAFGSWREDAEDLEPFMREVYANRRDDRQEPNR
jgi:hypothetical protein